MQLHQILINAKFSSQKNTHKHTHTNSHALTEQQKDLPTCAPLIWIREFIDAKTEMVRQDFVCFILNIPLIFI